MLIVFDLDGTLIDSSKDLAIAMNATREHLGLAPISAELIYSYVGNGAKTLVQRALGEQADTQSIEEGHRFFLEFYQNHAVDNTIVYPNIVFLLRTLAVRHKLAVLTNKPDKTSYSIVTALQLRGYFLKVYGGDSFPAKKPDPVGLLTLMHESGMAAADTLMVGDSKVDVQTARNAGVRSCGVLWGFQPEGLRTSDPDVLVEYPIEILDHLH